jgi:tellurite methyltransferase
MAPPPALADFGRIDIYLFDQLLRGRITPQMRILDAGCGGGRNLEYLLRCGAPVSGVDQDPEQILRVRALAGELAPSLPEDRFQVAELSRLPFPDRSFDAILCSAVLHFAADPGHFHRMLDELWRVLDRGGILFCRLASTIGMGDRLIPLEQGWYHLPDGSDRFLVSQEELLAAGRRLGGVLLDPLKTTLVQDMRAMTTWVLGKGE